MKMGNQQFFLPLSILAVGFFVWTYVLFFKKKPFEAKSIVEEVEKERGEEE